MLMLGFFVGKVNTLLNEAGRRTFERTLVVEESGVRSVKELFNTSVKHQVISILKFDLMSHARLHSRVR